MPIPPGEFYPAMKKNVPQLLIIRMHLTYLKQNKPKQNNNKKKQDLENRNSIVWLYLFKVWTKQKWMPSARGHRCGYFGQ